MFQQHRLSIYIVAVLIVMAIVVGFRWAVAGYAAAQQLLVFFAGFLIGMVAMYIAMHVYQDDLWPWRGL